MDLLTFRGNESPKTTSKNENFMTVQHAVPIVTRFHNTVGALIIKYVWIRLFFNISNKSEHPMDVAVIDSLINDTLLYHAN